MHPKFQGFQTPESKAASYCKLFGFYNGEGGFGCKKKFKKISTHVSYRRRLQSYSDSNHCADSKAGLGIINPGFR
jgi:hypothetical protein